MLNVLLPDEKTTDCPHDTERKNPPPVIMADLGKRDKLRVRCHSDG